MGLVLSSPPEVRNVAASVSPTPFERLPYGPRLADGTPRFVLEQRLGAGGMGVVYLAEDRERGMRVALKTLQNDDPGNLARFKREFRALADVAHPGLVGLYELFADDGPWFFTMEAIDGVRFDTFVAHRPKAGEVDHLLSTRVKSLSREDLATREIFASEDELHTGPIERLPRPVASLDRLLPALSELTDAVLALHRAGMTHCDLKPSNVLVTDDGRVVVLDFGLVRAHPRGDTGPSKVIEGTPHYLAPEIVKGSPPTPASDWYSIGVMLYWSLTGHLPLSSAHVGFVADSTPSTVGTRASAIVEGVPDVLDRLVSDLLAYDSELRADGRTIRRTLAALEGRDFEREGSTGAHRGLGEPPFVGREKELGELEKAFSDVARGFPTFALVRGPSGIGKSALVRELGQRLTDRSSALVLTGRCYEREQVRFKALDGVVDALAAHLARLPQTTLGRLLPEGARALTVLFPVLGAVDAIAAMPPLPHDLEPREVRAKALGAARELLARLGAEKPIVVLVDDVQWGDLDSAAFISQAIDPDSRTRLLFVGTARTETRESEVVRAIRNHAVRLVDLEIGPLSTSDCSALARSIVAGEDGAPREHAPSTRDDRAAKAAAEAIARDAGGSPFLALELARWAARSGSEKRPATLDEVVRRQVERLPDGARSLLEASALAGVPMPSWMLGRVAHVSGDPLPVVRLLCARQLLRASSVNLGEVEPYHDRVREVVASRLPSERRRELHTELGAMLLGMEGAEPEMVARHLALGGAKARALPLFVRAAKRAAAAFAYDHAVALHREALACAEESARPDLEAKLAEMMVLGGRSADAAPIFARLAARTGDGTEGERWRRRAAEEWLKCGRLDLGIDVLREVLRAVGLRYPDSQTEAMARAVARILRIRNLDGSFVPREERDIPTRDLARLDATRAAGTGLMLVDPLRGYGFLARFLLDAREIGEPTRVAAGLAFNAVTLCRGGEEGFSRATKWLAVTRRVATERDDTYLHGLADACEAGIRVCTGRWASAAELALSAPNKLRKSGTPATWECTAAISLGRTALYFKGDLQRLREETARHTSAADAVGDLFAGTYARVHGWFTAAMDDDLATGRKSLRTSLQRWSSLGFHAMHFWALYGELQYHLYEGTAQAGLERLAHAEADLSHSRILAMQFYRVFLRITEANLLLARGLPNDLRDAKRLAVRLSEEGPAYARAAAALVESHVAQNPSGAVEAAVRAVRLFELSDMSQYAGAARLRHADLVRGREGERAAAEVLETVARNGVKKPERWLEMLGARSARAHFR